MKNLLNQNDVTDIVTRLNTLDPNSPRKWGRMTINEILPHMTDPLRVAVGEKLVEPEKSVFYNTLLGKGIVWMLPWPKGSPTSQSFLPGTGLTHATAFEKDRQLLLKSIHQFVVHSRTMSFHPNPVFGHLTTQAWGRLMWRHINHHLCQFSA